MLALRFYLIAIRCSFRKLIKNFHGFGCPASVMKKPSKFDWCDRRVDSGAGICDAFPQKGLHQLVQVVVSCKIKDLSNLVRIPWVLRQVILEKLLCALAALSPQLNFGPEKQQVQGDLFC